MHLSFLPSPPPSRTATSSTVYITRACASTPYATLFPSTKVRSLCGARNRSSNPTAPYHTIALSLPLLPPSIIPLLFGLHLWPCSPQARTGPTTTHGSLGARAQKRRRRRRRRRRRQRQLLPPLPPLAPPCSVLRRRRSKSGQSPAGSRSGSGTGGGIRGLVRLRRSSYARYRAFARGLSPHG